MIGSQAPAPPVPLRQPDAIADHPVVLGLGRQIEIEFERRRRAVLIAADGELVEVTRDRLGAIEVVFVLGAAVDVDVFAPGEDVLHAHGNQATVLVRRVDALRTTTQTFDLTALSLGIALTCIGVFAPRRHGCRRRLRVQPQRYGRWWTPRRRQHADTARHAQRRTYGTLGRGLVGTQRRRLGTRRYVRFDQRGIGRAHAGETGQRRMRGVLAGREPVVVRRRLRHRQRGQPQIQIAIELHRWQAVDTWRQAQEAGVAPRQRDSGVTAGQALQPSPPRAVARLLGSDHLQAAVAAERAEHHPHRAFHIGEFDCGIRMTAVHQPRDQPVPEFTDLLFHSTPRGRHRSADSPSGGHRTTPRVAGSVTRRDRHFGHPAGSGRPING